MGYVFKENTSLIKQAMNDSFDVFLESLYQDIFGGVFRSILGDT